MAGLSATQACKRTKTRFARTKNCHLYLIGNQEYQWFKIGISKKIEERIKQLNTPFRLTTFYSLRCGNVSSALALENLMHIRYQDKRVLGEWFSSIDPEDFSNSVRQALESLIKTNINLEEAKIEKLEQKTSSTLKEKNTRERIKNSIDKENARRQKVLEHQASFISKSLRKP